MALISDLPKQKLREIAAYLDRFPSTASRLDEEHIDQENEFWRLLIRALNRVDRSMCNYSSVQIETLAMESLNQKSPSLELLLNLQQMKDPPSLEVFVKCLKEIGCTKALNIFKSATPPRITQQPQAKLELTTGDELLLTCDAECEPPEPQFQWFKRQTPIPMATSKTLRIGRVNENYTEVYVCRVMNPHINNSQKATVFSNFSQVKVYPLNKSSFIQQETGGSSEPSHACPSLNAHPSSSDTIVITRHPRSTTVHHGETVELTCEAHCLGGGPVEYQWSSKLLKEKKYGAKFVATMSCAKHHESKFCFHCVVTSASGASKNSNEAVVTVQPIWFTEQPCPRIGYAGEKAVLICKAQAADPQEIITYLWLASKIKDGNLVPVDRKLQTEDGVLSFDNLKDKDRGYYCCQAFNRRFLLTSGVVKLDVRLRSEKEVNQVAPVIRITKQPRSRVLGMDEKFRFVCEATCSSGDGLRYKWFKGGNEIPGETKNILEKCLVDLSDCGPYYCEVKTEGLNATAISKSVRLGLRNKTEGASVKPKTAAQMEQLKAEEVLQTAEKESFAREKLALLIGNSTYSSDQVNNLSGPENDVYKLAKALQKHDFKVLSYVNLKYDEMLESFEKFASYLKKLDFSGVYALFYYSGHGFRFGDTPYLVPTDAMTPLECDKCISSQNVKACFGAKPSLLILDSCQIDGTDYSVKPPADTKQPHSLGNSSVTEIEASLDGHAAHETGDRSTFNVALVKFLEEREMKTLSEMYDYISDEMKAANVSHRGSTFQRPSTKICSISGKISLFDEVMLDNDKYEADLDKVHEDFNSMNSLEVEVKTQLGFFLKLSFTKKFSNVLAVDVAILGESGADASVEIDTQFMERQNVSVDSKSKTLFHVCDLQRLKPEHQLKFSFKLSRGRDSPVYQLYTFPHKIPHP